MPINLRSLRIVAQYERGQLFVAHVSIYVYIDTHTHTHTHTHARARARACVCVCVYYACINVYMYITVYKIHNHIRAYVCTSCSDLESAFSIIADRIPHN